MSGIRITQFPNGEYAIYDGRNLVQKDLLAHLTLWAWQTNHLSFSRLFSIMFECEEFSQTVIDKTRKMWEYSNKKSIEETGFGTKMPGIDDFRLNS